MLGYKVKMNNVIKRLTLLSNRDKIYKTFLVLISIFIVSIWFKNHTIIAIGDEGLPFYNSFRSLKLYSSYFYDTGLGLKGNFNIPRTPLFIVTSILQALGFSPWRIQEIVFITLVLTALLSMYLLTRELLENKKHEVALISSLFYFFNIFTLSQVFVRFVYSLIFLWAYLPLFLLLWIRYLKLKNIRSLSILLLSSIAFSDINVILSPILTLWFCAGLYLLIDFIFNKQKILSLLKNVIFALILWIIVNSWWIYPFTKLTNNAVANGLNNNQSMTSLTEVSGYFPNNELLRLRQTYMIGPKSETYDHFNKTLVKNISWVIFAIVISGFAAALYEIFIKKEPNNKKIMLFSLLLFILGWFFCKGTNPPYGRDFFTFIFTRLPILQIYRNPYEKFGAVFLMGYSLLFAFGCNYLISKFRSLKFVILTLILYVALMFVTIPMSNGSLFGAQYSVIVPPYYEEANQLIKSATKNSETRILQLPFISGSVIKYDWNYTGEEPSEFLFDNASVSRINYNPFLDEYYNLLQDQRYFKNKNYTKILKLTGIDYIVLHDDYNSDNKSLVNLNLYNHDFEETKSILNNWYGINYLKTFGKIEIYKVSNNKNISRIYLSNNLITLPNIQSEFEYILSNKYLDSDSFFIKTQNDNDAPVLVESLLPKYEILIINKSKYKIVISNATKPFILVLNNNYGKEWLLSVDSKDLGTHFIVNGYSNGWLIDKKGSYTIDISFKMWPWE